MIFAKVSTDKTVTFGPVLAADGTMSNGALAYTDAKIFKNGTDGALDSSATFTHKYEGVYALLLKAADLDAVGTYEVVLNKNPLSAAPVKITVLAANVYDWLFGTSAPNVTTPPTAAAVATAVWQDSTAGDFTAASSIGKSLYTSGNAPGAASGLAIVGSAMTLAASQHVIVDSGTVTTLTNLPAAPADWLTASAVKADAVTKIQSGLSTLTQTQVSGGAYDLTNATFIAALKSGLGTVPASGNWATVGAKMDLADSLNATGVADLKTKLGTVPASGDWNTTTPPSTSDITTAILAGVIETDVSLKQQLQLIGAGIAGVVTGAGTGEETFTGTDKTTTRIVNTVDSTGNRSPAYTI